MDILAGRLWEFVMKFRTILPHHVTSTPAESCDVATSIANPIKQFANWFTAAIEAGIRDVNAMSFAAADRDARPSVRIVLFTFPPMRS
jgi:pyridoxine/pyridoxamine 5'-phosphate oxidase